MARAEQYNLIAAFEDDAHADHAVRDLTRAGVRGADVHILHPGRDSGPDARAALRSEMQDEVDESFAGPGVSFATKSQAKGAFVGTFAGIAAGAILGAAVGLLWVAFTHSAVGDVTRVAIAIIVFAIGGAAAGFIAGGAVKPRIEADRHDPMAQLGEQHFASERGTVVALHLRDRGTVDRAYRILTEAGAERVDAVNANGTPLPPQAEHPRPADPPERWWRTGPSKG
jgi:hypothetical protein